MTSTNDEPSTDHAAQATQLQADLAKLSVNAQFALDLSYGEQLTQPEIAVTMSLTESAVVRLISGAMQDLAQIIIATVHLFLLPLRRSNPHAPTSGGTPWKTFRPRADYVLRRA